MLIHKQELKMQYKQTLEMPLYAKILTVQVQHGNPMIWYKFDKNEPRKEDRRFLIVGTGNPSELHPNDQYISTFQLNGGETVWHVFETL